MGNSVSGADFKQKALDGDLDEVNVLLDEHPELANWTDEVEEPYFVLILGITLFSIVFR
jgi:hypothetical protein